MTKNIVSVSEVYTQLLEEEIFNEILEENNSALKELVENLDNALFISKNRIKDFDTFHENIEITHTLTISFLKAKYRDEINKRRKEVGLNKLKKIVDTLENPPFNKFCTVKEGTVFIDKGAFEECFGMIKRKRI